MANYGGKISKPGYSASATPTEATKKNFVILDQTSAYKVHYKGYVTTGTYTHNLGVKPFFLVFIPDSTPSPTYFTGSKDGYATTTTIAGLPNPSYLIVFKEGL